MGGYRLPDDVNLQCPIMLACALVPYPRRFTRYKRVGRGNSDNIVRDWTTTLSDLTDGKGPLVMTIILQGGM